jgi:ribose transport system permease protein
VTTSYLAMYAGFGIGAAVAIALAVALAVGVAQGTIIARFNIPPFVVTLGSMLLLRGVAEVLTGGSDVGFQGRYPGFRKLGEGIALGLPVPFWFAVGAIAIVAFLMHRTLFGRYCYAIGSNTEAARLSGIPVVRIRLFAFIGAAALSGVAGMLYVAYLPTATPSLGNAFELHAVAAAVLGGCSLQGGKGTVFGVLIGAGILQITFNAVNLIGQSLWQNVVAGGVILVAVIVDRLFEKSRGFGAGKKVTPSSPSTSTSTSASTSTGTLVEG